MARASLASDRRMRTRAKNPFKALVAAGVPTDLARKVSADPQMAASIIQRPDALAASAAIFRSKQHTDMTLDRNQIAQPWQRDVYRHINICGEARYASMLFSNVAGRAEIGVSEPSALIRKAVWVESGPEVDAFAEIAPTVRDRTVLVRTFMMHWVIAGEMYLIARDRMPHDPPGVGPLWEIVAVTELQRQGDDWLVRYDNDQWLELSGSYPIIRIWNPDPEKRREATSPFRALLPTLREIEWLTKHIFTQVRSRLMSAGVWFVPENLTFPAPPPSSVPGGEQAIAAMNEAEQFMVSLAATSSQLLDGDEVAFPTVVQADAAALAMIDQSKLIQFWSEIDDKAMTLRSDAVRRFALGMELPPEQVLGSSGLAVTGAGGSAGSVNHWGVWANEEQTISSHVEPALDAFVGFLTNGYLRLALPDSEKVIAYDTASLRLKQDRSKEATELYDRGELKADVMLRENGFDPQFDAMSEAEFARWLLKRMVSGSPSPEMMVEAAKLLGVAFPQLAVSGNSTEETEAKGLSGPAMPPSLDDHPYQGPPREQHDHSPAPYAVQTGSVEALAASAEGLVLRALEKAGNRLRNDGVRGRDRDMSTPAHEVHLVAGAYQPGQEVTFDFTTASVVFADLEPRVIGRMVRQMATYCADLYENSKPYSREGLCEAVEGLR